MFILHTSNRLERLADRLAAVLADPLPDGMQPETVVVQSRGMERWISMEMARRRGICANMKFPFPNALLEMLVQRVLPDFPRTPLLDVDAMTFRIMMLLPELLGKTGFAVLQRYLKDDRDGRKRFRLADKIARTFDQYLIYRPDWIFRWESGAETADADEQWQAELWRCVMENGSISHRANLQRRLLATLDELQPGNSNLPPRISVFGISYLPPFHLQLLMGLSHVTEIHFFLLNPCREFWADIVSESEALRMQRQAERSSRKRLNAEDLHLRQGHRLLSSLGQLGRDFLAMVSDQEIQFEEAFQEIDVQDCLSRLQADILHLGFDVAQGSAPPPKEADRSIQIHSCHSPMREIEVLYDSLLAMFEEIPDLQPKDVLVITPDIDHYTPYIQAVFGTQFDEQRRIPYRIVDQSMRRESRLVEDFFALLKLRNSRFGATEVVGLLESPQIRERFQLSERDGESVEQWILDLNIRWGIDGGERRKQGLPGFEDNTWRAGIERMLLGMALPGNGRRMFGGILPYDPIEGERTLALGHFLDFLQALFNWSRRLAASRTPARWQSFLLELLEAFFRIDETAESDIQAVRDALARLGALENQAPHPDELSIDIVEAFLDESLRQPGRLSAFISGGVTFGAMLPMRSIPFPVIALIGMNHDAFPREDRPPAFDRMERFPRRGDRSRRTDDRYLFLEALLSARRRFYISYVGQSIRDNSEIPPAVPVSELVDTLQRDCGIDTEAIVRKHPLQAFSPRYFNGADPRLFSYAVENCVARRGDRGHPPAFFTATLPEPSEDFNQIGLSELCRFFANPCRFLLRHRLGIRLEAPDTVPDDRENFLLSPLDRYRLGNSLTAQYLEGLDADFAYQLHRADGVLPLGTVGRCRFEEIQSEAASLARRIAAMTHAASGKQLEWRGTFSGVTVSGRLGELYEPGRVQFRFSPLRAPDLLSAWIQHLALGLAPERPCPPETFLIGKDRGLYFRPVEAPGRYFGELLCIYREGIRQPLPFFPELSLDCFERIQNRGHDTPAVLQHARKCWIGNPYRRGVADDPDSGLCFRQIDPIGEHFLRLAAQIYRGLLEHGEELPGAG